MVRETVRLYLMGPGLARAAAFTTRSLPSVTLILAGGLVTHSGASAGEERAMGGG